MHDSGNVNTLRSFDSLPRVAKSQVPNCRLTHVMFVLSTHALGCFKVNFLKYSECLLAHVICFLEALEAAIEELMHHSIACCLDDLSEKLNSFYTECHERASSLRTASSVSVAVGLHLALTL